MTDDHQTAIPLPPSPRDIDRISQDQVLIADEWGCQPPHPESPQTEMADTPKNDAAKVGDISG